MRPEVGLSSPAMHLKTVVFPQPEGPRIVRNSPSLIVRLRFSTALTLPKYFVKPSSLTETKETTPLTCFLDYEKEKRDIKDLLKTFDTVYTLTYGGPGNATTTYPFYIFKTGFTLMSLHPSYGYTALLSVVLLVVATILTTVIMRILKIEKLIWG